MVAQKKDRNLEIVRRYVEDKDTAYVLSEAYDISYTRIREILEEYGIRMRKDVIAGYKRHIAFVCHRMTIPEIAAVMDLDSQLVRRYLRELGLKAISKGEAWDKLMGEIRRKVVDEGISPRHACEYDEKLYRRYIDYCKKLRKRAIIDGNSEVIETNPNKSKPGDLRRHIE